MTSIFEPLYFVKMGPIFISSAFLHFKKHQNSIQYCHHFWVGLVLLCCCTHPKAMTKMVKKCSTFCSTDQRFIRNRNTTYRIHTLGRTLLERLCVHPIFWPWIPFGIVAKNWLRGVSKNCKKIKIHKLTFKLSTNCCCLTKKSLGKCLQASRSIIGECNTRGLSKVT